VLELTSSTRTFCLPRLNFVSNFSSPLVLPRAIGEGIVLLGGTSNACTVAHVEDEGDGNFVIEDAVSTAYRYPTPHQLLFYRNQLNAYRFVNILFEC
jgi:hypothetical protein